MAKDVYEIEGRRWLSIAAAARRLRTNAQGIRKLMADGSLDWCQSRANSSRFVVAEQGVTALLSQLPAEKRRLALSPDPLRSPKKPMPQRPPRGGARDMHHLRMTLPAIDEDEAKRRR